MSAESEKNLKTADNKNALNIFCKNCPSKILQSAKGVYFQKDVELPKVEWKPSNTHVEGNETISEYWQVDDINSFDNVGVSHTVNQFKYLACADCERGPIGWFDIHTHKSYVALSRVKYS